MFLLPLLIATAIGAVFGAIHAVQLFRHGSVSLDTVHRHTQIPHYALLVSLMAVLTATLVGCNRSLLWELPFYWEIARAFTQWTPMPMLLSYTAALACILAWRERHARRVSVTIASILIVTAMLAISWRLTRPVYGELSQLETTDGVILQTSPVSCAAASAANISRLLGRTATERLMARTLQTTPFGTSDAGILIGMRSLGFKCRRVNVSVVTEVRRPAMLFVDHPATGFESHVVTLASCNDNRAEILNPLIGRVWMASEELDQIWHGKALEVGQ